MQLQATQSFQKEKLDGVNIKIYMQNEVSAMVPFWLMRKGPSVSAIFVSHYIKLMQVFTAEFRSLYGLIENSLV